MIVPLNSWYPRVIYFSFTQGRELISWDLTVTKLGSQVAQALSDTCRYINLTELGLGQVALRGRVTSRRQFSKSCMFLFLK